MSAVKRFLESLDELDRVRDSLMRQGADASDLMDLGEQVASLRAALPGGAPEILGNPRISAP